ncbi:MAG: tetratricopeptide repeat protein, partial [Blastocatellia bacterium]
MTAEERHELESWRLSQNREQARRAEVVLLCANGKTPPEIALELDCHPTSVKKWIRRFSQSGLDGLHVKKRGPREGPRPSFTREQIAGLLELARTDPARLGLRFKRWTAQKLANAAIERGIVRSISHVTVQQVLNRHGFRDVGAEGGGGEGLSAQTGAFLAAGKQALANSEFGKAVECFRTALEGGRHSPEEVAEIRLLLSEAFDEGGKFEEAYSVVEIYEQPEALAPLSAGTKGRVKLRIGWVQSLLTNYPRALASINEAKKIFQEIQDEHGIGQAHYALGRTYISISEFSIAHEHLVTALTHNGSAGDMELAARIHLTLGAVDYYEGSFGSSKQNALRALNLAEQCGNPSVTAVALLNLGLFHNEPDERKESAGYLTRAIKILETIGHKDLALAYNNLGDNLRHSGDWGKAVECLNAAIEAGERLNQSTHLATADVTLAEVLCSMGKFEDAEKWTKKGLDLARRLSDKWIEGYGLRVLGSIHCNTGRIDSALALLRQAVRVSALVGETSLVALSECVLVEAYLNEGEVDQAREHLEITRGRLKEEKSRSLFLTGIVQRLNGQLDCRLGRYAEGKQHIAQSISIFKKSDTPYEQAKSHLAMGELLTAGDDATDAESHLRESKEIFDALGAEPDSRRAVEMLALLESGSHEVPRPPRLPASSAQGAPSSASAPGPPGAPGMAVVRGPVTPLSNRQPTRAVRTSDALLMQRLIEASSSRELLMQELAAVVYENFQTEVVLIYRIDDSGVLEPIVSQGVALTEAQRLCGEIRQTAQISRANGKAPIILELKPGSGGRYSRSQSHICLYVKPVEHNPLDLQRLQPLIMQAELGLELCAFRYGAGEDAPAMADYRTQVVMPGFIIASAAMSRVIERIQKIKTSDVTVLITGESGTGKELVARAVHTESARARAIFL